MIPANLILKDCRSVHNKGSLEIHPYTTVMDLEQEFQDSFGLSIQVFRKSGDVWIETTVTDDWTLAKQNEEAESFYNAVQEAKRQIEIKCCCKISTILLQYRPFQSIKLILRSFLKSF